MMKNESHLYKKLPFVYALRDIILDGFFPIQCLGCGAYDEWICAQCHTTLPILTEQICPLCKKHTTNNGELCPFCIKKKNHVFDGVFVTSYYNDPLLKKMIHYYKYRFVRDLAKPLALLIAQSLQNAKLPAPDIIIPVPLHKRRLRWRGFNQAEELACALDLQIPIFTDILERVRYTTPQVKMKKKKKRQENLSRAFFVVKKDVVAKKNILLVDDIMTTGTTLAECAQTLKKTGAKTVFCLVLARE